MKKDKKKDESQNRVLYNLQIDEKQARVLIGALDLFSRIKIGQIKEVEAVIRWASCAGERTVPIENLDAAGKLLNEVQRLLFPELGGSNASYGIREAPGEDEKIAYDIQQVVRHRIAWDGVEPGKKPEGVWGYEPWATSDHPLPKIEKVSA